MTRITDWLHPEQADPLGSGLQALHGKFALASGGWWGDLTPMVGRDEELALLGGRWRKVIEGEGQIVVVSGDAGIGKSRLIEALRRDLDVGSHWFDVRGSSYHKSSELHPVIELVEHRGLEGTTGAAAEARLSRLVSIMGLDEEESLSVLAPLFSLPDVPPSLLLPAEQRLRILGILGSALWHLAESSPTVVALEDLQWLDPTTIEALRTLVPLVGTRRVLLVMTCRSEFEVPWSYQPNELRLSLDRLDVDRSQELVESVASNRALPDAVIREVLAKSDGVPLFLEEVARMLVEEPGAIETVPERLEGLLAAKLDRLPAHVLETARVGAVIGRHVPREVLREVSPKGPQAIDMDATALIEAGVFLPDDGGYVFKHVLLRDAAYERMLRSTREDIHRRVATVLRARFPHLSDTQPELVAHHFTQAGASTEAQVAWTQAGARSLRNGAYVEAVYHFRSALEQLERSASAFGSQDVQEELRLRKDLGVCLIATQGYTSDAVAENYRLALQRSAALHDRQEELPIHVLYGLWGTCLVGGDREATDELAKHFERVERSTDPLARHVAHSTLGARAFYRGDYAEALTRCQEAMRLYEPANHFVLLRDYGYEGGLYSYQYVAYTLCFTGFPDQGLEYAKQGLRLADSIGDPYARAVALSGVACVARERREREPALASAAGLLELAQQRQFVMWVGIAHCLHGWARLDVDPAGGADEIRDGLRIWAATGARVPGTYLRLSLIEAELALGRVDAGLEAVEDGLRQCRATLESYLEPEYHRLQGELLRLKDDDKAAEREIRRALREAAGQGAAWIELRAALSLARLAAASGGPPDALGRLSDVRARLTEGADTPDMREATALLAAAV
jgi:tetratricopeptide (TPR) repeat protein